MLLYAKPAKERTRRQQAGHGLGLEDMQKYYFIMANNRGRSMQARGCNVRLGRSQDISGSDD